MIDWVRGQRAAGSSDAGEAPPEWGPPSPRLRVLVETTDQAERRAITGELTAAGFQTLSCGGPYSLHDRECALVADGYCQAAAGADVVFHRFNPANPANRAILGALRRSHPKTPVIVEIARADSLRFADVLAGCSLLDMPADTAAMVAAIRSAVAPPLSAPAPL